MLISSKSSLVASEIERRIDAREFVPGGWLGTKANLASEYEVAAGTLNEAVRLLVERGYVTVKTGPKGGVFVSQGVSRSALTKSLSEIQPAPASVTHWIQVQDALQEVTVVEAARAFQESDPTGIGEAVQRLEDADDIAQRFAAMWELDRRIAVAGSNPVLARTYVEAVDAIERQIGVYPDSEVAAHSTVGAVEVHREMAHAVMAGDVKRARLAAAQHSPND